MVPRGSVVVLDNASPVFALPVVSPPVSAVSYEPVVGSALGVTLQDVLFTAYLVSATSRVGASSLGSLSQTGTNVAFPSAVLAAGDELRVWGSFRAVRVVCMWLCRLVWWCGVHVGVCAVCRHDLWHGVRGRCVPMRVGMGKGRRV